jgi:hypothetical protein
MVKASASGPSTRYSIGSAVVPPRRSATKNVIEVWPTRVSG